jgi:hypothetical protein
VFLYEKLLLSIICRRKPSVFFKETAKSGSELASASLSSIRQVLAEAEAKKKAAAAQRAREAQRASTNKSFKYKGGLTIEEHSDEEDGKGGFADQGYAASSSAVCL